MNHKVITLIRIYLFCVILSELLMPAGIGLQINYIVYYVLRSGSTFYLAVAAAIVTMIILIASYLETRNGRLRIPYTAALFIVFSADVVFLLGKILTGDHNSLTLMLLGVGFRAIGIVLLIIHAVSAYKKTDRQTDTGPESMVKAQLGD